MLRGKLIHPDIMAALALCGHGDKVLIADGNYPLDSKTGQTATVYMGLTPGLPTVTDVLEAIQSVVNIEKAEVMDPADGTTPEIFGQFQSMLGGEPSGQGCICRLCRNVRGEPAGFWLRCIFLRLRSVRSRSRILDSENCIRLRISAGKKHLYWRSRRK